MVPKEIVLEFIELEIKKIYSVFIGVFNPDTAKRQEISEKEKSILMHRLSMLVEKRRRMKEPPCETK